MSRPDTDQRVRLEDVAAHLGISMATVSLALRGAPGPSEKTRRRVFEAVELLGYRPDRAASALARGKSLNIGVVTHLSDAFHALLVEGLYEASQSEHCEIILSAATPSRSEFHAAQTLLDSRCEVLILLGPHGTDEEIIRLSKDKPVISVGRKVEADTVDVVRVLDRAGVNLGVRQLAELGHQRIVYADGGHGPLAKERREGYREGMQAAGLAAETLILDSGHSRNLIDQTVEGILALEHTPTAVVTSDDECAVGLVESLRLAGIAVPNQISVLGYDDSPVSRLLHVALSTVSQNPAEQAQAAVKAAMERLRGDRSEPVEILLEPQIILRSTTAPLTAEGIRQTS